MENVFGVQLNQIVLNAILTKTNVMNVMMVIIQIQMEIVNHVQV